MSVAALQQLTGVLTQPFGRIDATQHTSQFLDPTGLVETVRHAAASLDPRVPVYDIRTMDQRVAASIAQPRLTLVLVGAFSLVSLGLAAIAIGPVSLSSAIMGTRPVLLLLWAMASGLSFRQTLRSRQGGGPPRARWASACLVTVGVGVMAF